MVGKDAQAGVGEGVMVDMAVDRSGKMGVTVGHERGITVWDAESATKKRKCVYAWSGLPRSAWCTVGGCHAPGRLWAMALVVNLDDTAREVVDAEAANSEHCRVGVR